MPSQSPQQPPNMMQQLGGLPGLLALLQKGGQTGLSPQQNPNAMPQQPGMLQQLLQQYMNRPATPGTGMGAGGGT
jgi:hypothetical protein